MNNKNVETTLDIKIKSVMILSPAVPIFRFNNQLFFDRKFFDGLAVYCQYWPGIIRLVVCCEEMAVEPPFGLVPYDEVGCPFELVILGHEERLEVKDLAGVELVLASADNHHNFYLPKLCQELGIACVMDIEYTLKTRVQMVLQEKLSPIKLAKTIVWLCITELRRRAAIKRACGIQANGIPAHAMYSYKPNNAMYYFDNRMDEGMMIAKDMLKSRLARLQAREPLRLAFSGRLIQSKGADALIDLAIELVREKVAFILHIFGAGDLDESIKERIQKHQLDRVVVFHGAVDFKEELVPFMKADVDLFVCCHRQGDPSCTYLETYGCGLPIVGFKNEAHQSMVDRFNTGWYVPMDSVAALAYVIKSLDINRGEIISKSQNAIEFARQNTFMKLFRNRIDHCIKMANSVKLTPMISRVRGKD